MEEGELQPLEQDSEMTWESMEGKKERHKKDTNDFASTSTVDSKSFDNVIQPKI